MIILLYMKKVYYIKCTVSRMNFSSCFYNLTQFNKKKRHYLIGN